MSCWAIIPIKATFDSKSRLAGVLEPDERQALAVAMVGRVVAAAQASNAIDRVCLLGPSRLGLSEDIPLLDDPGTGLNPAVSQALDQVATHAPHRVIFIHGDLPLVSPDDLTALARVTGDSIAIAPDRHRTGTNALSLPLPEARGFAFAFGPDSFHLHKAEGDRLGLPVEVIESRGLESDIDEPDDYFAFCEAVGKV
ncbi:MAG: 2-phospho-L-lactate guanylyltransferase [Sphingomonadaceae bacterium]